MRKTNLSIFLRPSSLLFSSFLSGLSCPVLARPILVSHTYLLRGKERKEKKRKEKKRKENKRKEKKKKQKKKKKKEKKIKIKRKEKKRKANKKKRKSKARKSYLTPSLSLCHRLKKEPPSLAVRPA